MIKKVKYFIIGAGPIGLYFAKLCNQKRKSYFMIDKHHQLGGQPKLLYPKKHIYDYPEIKKITGENLVKKLSKNIKKYILDASVNGISKKEAHFVVRLSNTDVYEAENIIVATGIGEFTSNKLDIPGDKTNVVYEIKNPKTISGDICVLGGGDSACDWANQLAKQGCHVNLIYRNAELKCPPYVNNILKKNKNIDIHLLTNVIEIKNKNTLVIQDKTTEKVSEIKFSKIVVQWGVTVKPQVLFKKLGVKVSKKNNRILVDKNNMTSIKGIYAIGDCCTYKGKENTMACGNKEAEKIIK